MKKNLTKTEGFHNNGELKYLFDATARVNEPRIWRE